MTFAPRFAGTVSGIDGLGNYDATLIRRVEVPSALTRQLKGAAGYILVGRGWASELVQSRFPCLGSLAPAARRNAIHSLGLARGASPTGPSFCFLLGLEIRGSERVGPISVCDTFADAARGYGSEVTADSNSPEIASVVPDGVATVVLRYSGHAPITARVHDNVYWVDVPRWIPYASGPPLSRPQAVHGAILHSIPTSVRWLDKAGRAINTFTPPAAYVTLQTGRYRECIENTCGA